MTRVDHEAAQRTKAYARVLGPFIAVVTTVLVFRLQDAQPVVDNLFANPATVWILGAAMLGMGLVIIGGHRHWRSVTAAAISLFGWFVAVRGAALMAAAGTMRDAVDASLDGAALVAARVFFVLLCSLGLWFTYVGWFRKSTAPAARG
ncbi:hypothetical protein [Nocardia wallacei]|uniref:hypothetical protein n=1 Tax=Nocardia wallacei TaxID=480035 RepID=UPI002458AB45|nr:hypothetical protein [Nocardia wallacei]